jgi:Protein of unknown function (DUF2786)
MRRSNHFRRLQALLAMTVARGCTEAEAAAAIQKAHELVARVGIVHLEMDLAAERGRAVIKVTGGVFEYRFYPSHHLANAANQSSKQRRQNAYNQARSR